MENLSHHIVWHKFWHKKNQKISKLSIFISKKAFIYRISQSKIKSHRLHHFDK